MREAQRVACLFGFGATILEEGFDRPPPYRAVNSEVQAFRMGRGPNPRTLAQQQQMSFTTFAPVPDCYYDPVVPPTVEERRAEREARELYTQTGITFPILFRREPAPQSPPFRREDFHGPGGPPEPSRTLHFPTIEEMRESLESRPSWDDAADALSLMIETVKPKKRKKRHATKKRKRTT